MIVLVVVFLACLGAGVTAAARWLPRLGHGPSRRYGVLRGVWLWALPLGS